MMCVHKVTVLILVYLLIIGHVSYILAGDIGLWNFLMLQTSSWIIFIIAPTETEPCYLCAIEAQNLQWIPEPAPAG